MKKFALMLVLVIATLTLFGCTTKQQTFQVHKARSYEHEHKYFDSTYIVTTYEVEFHYIYNDKTPCYEYKFQIINKNDQNISNSDSFRINGILLSTAYRPYLRNGDIVSIAISINYSSLSSPDYLDTYSEFTIELINMDSDNEINLISKKYTFDTIKSLCR